MSKCKKCNDELRCNGCPSCRERPKDVNTAQVAQVRYVNTALVKEVEKLRADVNVLMFYTIAMSLCACIYLFGAFLNA